MSKLFNSDEYFRSKKVLDMFKVEQLPCPDMTVHINSGTVIFQNQVLDISEQISQVITAPSVGTWLVVLSLTENGEIKYTYGVQSTEKCVLPRLPENCLHLCAIEVSASSKSITNNDIHDMRSIYTYSANEETTCSCKCAIDSSMIFTEEDRKQLKEFYDKYEELATEIDKLKLLHQPQKAYRVLSDNGLLYEIRFHDDGTPYFTRVDGYDDNPCDPPKHLEYRFITGETTVNIVGHNCDDFFQAAVKIKSFDTLNDAANCTLCIRCPNTTIYSENYAPQYRENEFIISNLDLTKSGFYEIFSLCFHNDGTHTLTLVLYDNETGRMIDKTQVGYEVEFIHDRPE